MPDTNAGIGSSGVTPGSQLSQDIASMSDQAKRLQATQGPAMQANTQQNLNAAFGGPGQIQSLKDQIADHVNAQLAPSPDTNPHQYIAETANRIAELEKQQNLAKKAKNIKAVQTYDQVIGILRERMMGVQNKLAQQPLMAPQAPQMTATQPATQPQGGFVQGQ